MTLADRPHGDVHVVYVAVEHRDYPRNERLRQVLADHLGARVTVIDAAAGGSYLSRVVRDLRGAARACRAATTSVVVLAEFSTRYAAFTWVLARACGALHVVDGFVGMHETQVGDWGRYRRGSPRALVYALLDRIAYRTSDLYLIDTEVRARKVDKRYRGRDRALALPVGAPAWCAWPGTGAAPGTGQADTLDVLYYGNYLPLHGLDLVLEAVAAARAHRPLRLTMVGEGAERPRIEALTRSLGMVDMTSFVDAVPPSRLVELMGEHDVTLGVFGASEKAGDVVANKVWQALYLGVPVITRRSPALDELPKEIRSSLIQVGTAGPGELCSALLSVEASGARTAHQAARHRRTVDDFVVRRHRLLPEVLAGAAGRGRHARTGVSP